jgi:hypothetical protein
MTRTGVVYQEMRIFIKYIGMLPSPPSPSHPGGRRRDAKDSASKKD